MVLECVVRAPLLNYMSQHLSLYTLISRYRSLPSRPRPSRNDPPRLPKEADSDVDEAGDTPGRVAKISGTTSAPTLASPPWFNPASLSRPSSMVDIGLLEPQSTSATCGKIWRLYIAQRLRTALTRRTQRWHRPLTPPPQVRELPTRPKDRALHSASYSRLDAGQDDCVEFWFEKTLGGRSPVSWNTTHRWNWLRQLRWPSGLGRWSTMWGSQCCGRSIGGERRKTVPDEQINARTADPGEQSHRLRGSSSTRWRWHHVKDPRKWCLCSPWSAGPAVDLFIRRGAFAAPVRYFVLHRIGFTTTCRRARPRSHTIARSNVTESFVFRETGRRHPRAVSSQISRHRRLLHR